MICSMDHGSVRAFSTGEPESVCVRVCVSGERARVVSYVGVTARSCMFNVIVCVRTDKSNEDGK